MEADAQQFFTGLKTLLTLVDVKPKLNQQNDKRIRLDFSMPITYVILKSAPEDIKDAFYALSKDNSHMNPIGITTEFEGVIVSIFDTPLTKHARLELANCTLKQLEVARPETKLTLSDGDVRLSFHMNVPASRESWLWSYEAYGSDLCAVFEAMQPVFPTMKEANPNGDGQGILEMERQEAEPTVPKKTKTGFSEADRDEMPHQGKEQAAAVRAAVRASFKKIEPAKRTKKAKARK